MLAWWELRPQAGSELVHSLAAALGTAGARMVLIGRSLANQLKKIQPFISFRSINLKRASA